VGHSLIKNLDQDQVKSKLSRFGLGLVESSRLRPNRASRLGSKSTWVGVGSCSIILGSTHVTSSSVESKSCWIQVGMGSGQTKTRLV